MGRFFIVHSKAFTIISLSTELLCVTQKYPSALIMVSIRSISYVSIPLHLHTVCYNSPTVIPNNSSTVIHNSFILRWQLQCMACLMKQCIINLNKCRSPPSSLWGKTVLKGTKWHGKSMRGNVAAREASIRTDGQHFLCQQSWFRLTQGPDGARRPCSYINSALQSPFSTRLLHFSLNLKSHFYGLLCTKMLTVQPDYAAVIDIS